MSKGFVLAGLLALSGCAGYAPTASMVGQTPQMIIQVMGQPGYTQDGYVDYMRGPYGVHTYRLHFDGQNRLTRWEQLLTEEQFLKVREGMTRTQVISLIGISKVVSTLSRGRGEVWSYRYENSLCRWFQVEMDTNEIVRSAGYGSPPECSQKIIELNLDH